MTRAKRGKGYLLPSRACDRQVLIPEQIEYTGIPAAFANARASSGEITPVLVR
jgi:hypothetical protein